jgi:transcriptional regulator with XRE-family HTH domain
MTQAQLAERANLAVESVSRLETGRLKNVSVDVAERLAHALGVSLAILFGPTTPPKRIDRRRPIEKRIVVMLAHLPDGDLDQVYQGLRRLLGVRERLRRE